VRFPLVVLKSLFLLAAFSLVPVAVTWIFFGQTAGVAAFSVVAFWVLIDAAGSDSRIRKALRPSPLRIGDADVLAIEDPSSHVFITQRLFSSEPTVWITRGALSLFSPEETLTLAQGLRSAAKNRGLRFETVLTAWMIRLSSKLPTAFTELLFFKRKRNKFLLIHESIQGAIWLSILCAMDWFYFSPKSSEGAFPEELIRKMEAESRRCVPKLPVALSNHSLVSPWPDAFLNLGRSCLLPPRVVNLKA
jgi:hypothetical protein